MKHDSFFFLFFLPSKTLSSVVRFFDSSKIYIKQARRQRRIDGHVPLIHRSNQLFVCISRERGGRTRLAFTIASSMNGVVEEFPSKTVEKASPFRDRTKSSHNCREQCETILPPLFANFSSSSRAKNIVRTMKIYQAFTSLAPSSPESLIGRTRDNWWQVSQ